MGKCLSKQTRKVILVMVGLDNAGKTTTAKGLVGESPADVAPTLGFSSFHLKHQNFDVTIYDVGGNKSIRGIWRNYLAEAFGFIFVVDASDSTRVEECKEVLHSLLKNPVVSGKPFLILVNKQDVENALDEVEVSGLLHIEPIVNEVKSRTRVETCSALSISSKKPDRGIQMGFRWLLATIGVDFDNLQLKVEQDVVIQREIEAKEKLEREERIKKLREERQRQDDPKQVQDMSYDHIKKDPFQPVNIVVKTLQEKESQQVNNHISTMMNMSNFQEPEIIETQAPPHDPNENGRKQSSGSSKSACELIHDAPLNVNSEKSSHKSSVFSTETTVPPGLVHNEHDIDKPPVSRQSTIDDDDEFYVCTSRSSSNMSPQKNQQIELEKVAKSRKRKLFARNNKTAPKQEAFLGELPPLVIRSDNAVPWIKMTPPSLSSAQMDTVESDSDVNVNWNLAEDLEVR